MVKDLIFLPLQNLYTEKYMKQFYIASQYCIKKIEYNNESYKVIKFLWDKKHLLIS